MAQTENVFESYASTSKSMFDFWVSFFPTAPMFGVEWRFGKLTSVAPTETPKPAKQKSKAAPTAKKVAAPVATETAVPVVEAVDKAPTPTIDLPEVIETPKADVEISAEATKPVLLTDRPETIDALTKIKGVGPGLEKQLHALGIYTFSQLSDLNDTQLEWLDQNLKTVKGRCIRDDWAGQAKALMT